VSILTAPVRQVDIGKVDSTGVSGGSAGEEDRMKKIMMSGVLLALAACSQQQSPVAVTSQEYADQVRPAPTVAVPAGSYTLDKSHASLIFRVNHLGFSNYTARFKRFDARLEFDPKNLAASNVIATVDANSLETDFPNPTQVDFNAQLKGDEWLNVAKFPEMKFESKQIHVLGENTVRINGDLTLHGVTRPIVLDARFNGGYAGQPMDPNARIGFSAHGTLKRSEFGITYGIPAPGTTMGVGDDVNVVIEAEFTGPPWAGTQNAS
jgi:polyisoprenoid-binding protein YceI